MVTIYNTVVKNENPFILCSPSYSAPSSGSKCGSQRHVAEQERHGLEVVSSSDCFGQNDGDIDALHGN
jgi:hypothetical protein